MRELQRCRYQPNKFTVRISYLDSGVVDEEGLFSYVTKIYRLDTEEELITVFNNANNMKADNIIFAEEVDCIYYGKQDVTDTYLDNTFGPYQLRPQYIKA